MAVYSGFLAVSTGPLSLLIMSGLFGMTMLQIQGTEQISWLLIGIGSFWIFHQAGYVDWPSCFAMLAGMTSGGHIGAKFALRMGNKKLKTIFLIAALIAAVALFIN